MDWVDGRRADLGDIYRINAGPVPVVLLFHPDHAKRVLLDNAANYAKQGTFWSSIRSLIGLGLPTIEGEVWKSRRRMMNPQFRRKRIALLADAMVDAIEESLDAWSHDEQNIAAPVSAVTMAVIVRTMFGTGMPPQEAAQVSEAMSFSLNHMIQKIVTDALPGWLPVPGRAAHREAVAKIDEVLFSIIERRRAQPEPNDDLLTMLLEMRDEEGDGTGLNDQELRDETMSLFVAGYETTASAITWTCGRMAAAPELYEALRAEVQEVLGDRRPTPADLPKLEFTSRVFEESLRLDAPVWFLAREAVAEDEIAGHRIEAGTMVSMMIDRIHRHPDFWPDPERFDPDRFLPEAVKGRHPCAWMPFGMGQRMCIGKGFAMMEGVFLLAMIVQRFRFELTDAGMPEVETAITRRPKGGLPLTVHAA